MGKELSHIFCAQQAAARRAAVGGQLHNLLASAPHAYHFGAIAADTFFYAVRLPGEPARSGCCGDLVHGADGNDTSAPVHEMLKALREAPDDPLFAEKTAFVSGFLTHVALDTSLHPYVYHVSGNYYADCPVTRREAQVRHRLIESWLDLHMLQQNSLDLGRCNFLRDIRRNEAVNRELLQFFFSACARVLPLVPAAFSDLLRGYRVQMTLNTAFGNAAIGAMVRRLDRLLAGRMSAFLALFYPWDDGPVPRDIVEFSSYRHPVTGEERFGGFAIIWEEALTRAEGFLDAAEAFLFAGQDDALFLEEVRGYNFSTGLVGVPIRDAIHYNCIPLELLWRHGAGGRRRA
jgi:hypothetical protein